MTEPRPPGRSAAEVQRATVRGISVLVVAVIVGAVVYAQGFKGDKALEAANTTTTTSTVPPEQDRDAAPTTTSPRSGTTAPRTLSTKVPPAQTSVLVANGVDPSQVIAGPNAQKLRTAGYTVTGSVDLTSPSATSFVYYASGYEAEAQAVAKELGLPVTAVTPMPDPPPTPLGSAQILVVIGKDRA